MTINGAIKTGIATTITSAALTAGAITGAVLLSAMGTAALVALTVASVVLGVFTLLSASCLIGGGCCGDIGNGDKKACEFFGFMGELVTDIFKCCFCCKRTHASNN